MVAPAEALAGLSVLHQDAELLAIDKPPGWLVIPGRVAGEASLREQVAERFGPVWVVHRLDRGTSGLLLFARTAQAHRDLNVQFERGEPRKTYLALVTGHPPDRFACDAGIAPARKGRMKPVPAGDPRGKPALTRFEVLERFEPGGGFDPLAWIEARPETGRTHQIRVHLLAAGYPLAVDPDYGEAGPLRLPGGATLARTPLHAARLTVRHPAGHPLSLEAPLPGDLRAALAALRAAPAAKPAAPEAPRG